MGDWIISLVGTDEGRRLALFLAVAAAFLHAVMAAMQKARFDPWTSRAAMDFSYGVMTAPFALFVFPWPEPEVWPILGLALLVHVVYKLLQATAFTLAALTVVYPIIRGVGPLVTVIAAGFVFGETFTLLQWAGVLTLVAGVFGLAGLNLMRSHYSRASLLTALPIAVLTGITVAGYTTIDAFGVRATANPFTFLAWLFMIDGLMMPTAWIALRRGMFLGLPVLRLLRHGVIGGAIGVASFSSIMLATRLDQVGQAAVMRETSTVFAAIIGWLFLKEFVGPWRGFLIGLIAAGAVLVEFAG